MSRFARSLLFAALSATSLGFAPLHAEVTEQTSHGVVGDNQFLRSANAGGMAEVATSLVAQGQSQDMEVRQLADLMVLDHTRSNSLLTNLARNKHVDLPSELEATHRARLDALMNQKGAEFDKAYLEAVRVDHEAMIGLFETASRTGTDKEVRQYATDVLPILQNHLVIVKRLQAK